MDILKYIATIKECHILSQKQKEQIIAYTTKVSEEPDYLEKTDSLAKPLKSLSEICETHSAFRTQFHEELSRAFPNKNK